MSARKTTAKAAPASGEELRHWYREMLLIRRFEEKAGQLYGMGLIGGFCHLGIGQEAVSVGIEAASQPGDRRITSYRNHALMLACGMDPNRIMAELTGRATGYSGGKGGSMHMFSPQHGFYGGHGIVGSQVPIGAGLAFADRYKGNKAVTFTYLGDGAADQGQVYESFNLAARWDLPVVFVIENNQHSADLPLRRAAAAMPDLVARGKAFGIPSDVVDGMVVEQVRASAVKAAKHARAGKGPYILELKTYRYRGHSMSDPAKYRTREEMLKTRAERDPIDHVRQLLLSEAHATEDDLKTIDKDIKSIINAAADYARESPDPDTGALHSYVYAGE